MNGKCDCGNITRKGRKCRTCESRKYRAKDPVKTAYQTLRSNAKRRNKPFCITLDEFRSFCVETRYMEGKGRTKTSYSIDCEVNELGYLPGNIRKLTVSDNSKKHTKSLQYDWQNKTFIVVNLDKHILDDGQPNPF